MRLDEMTREEGETEMGCHLRTERRGTPTFRSWTDEEGLAKRMRKSSHQGRKKARREVSWK